MRAWFWTLLLASLAVVLAIVLRDHGGNVLILMPPWRIELSLTLAVLLGLGLFLLLYVMLRVVAWFAHSPQRLRQWRGVRAGERDITLLESAWMADLQGQIDQAQKDLGKLLARARSAQRKVLTALVLARVQHQGGRYDACDQALELAQSAANTPRLRALASTAAAALLLERDTDGETDDRSTGKALALLQSLPDASVREPYAARLLLQAHRQLGQHDQVQDLARLLWRRGILNKSLALKDIEAAAAARLAQCDTPGSVKSLWGALKSEEKTLPGVALQAAAMMEREGNVAEAARILEAAIAAHDDVDPRLLAAYAHCPPEQVAHRLSRAEGWLKSHPDHPGLLAALGNLCLIGQLWGQSERYLQRSLRLRQDPRVLALLGNLYDRIGRFDDAVRQWRLAANTDLPALALDEHHVLPAADMRGDPRLLDAESPAQDESVVEEWFTDSPAPLPSTPNALKEKHES